MHADLLLLSLLLCAGCCMLHHLPTPFPSQASPQHSACSHVCLPGACCCRLSDAEVEAAVASKRAELMAALEAEKQADGDK